MKKKYPVQMDWVNSASLGCKLPIYYSHYLEIVDPLHSFISALAKHKTRRLPEDYDGFAIDSGVNAPALHLKAYLEFLCEHDLTWQEASDDILEKFRDWERTRIKAKPSASGEAKKASETVNVKLKTIYQFYGWAQTLAGLLNNRVGTGMLFKIRSCIADEYKKTGTLSLPSQRDGGMSENSRYPLLLTDIGENNDTEVGYVATPEDYRRLRDYFNDPDTCGKAVARRNILIMNIAKHTGWRRTTICKLKTSDFMQNMIDAAIEEGRASIRVTPSSQKFNYQNQFEVTIPLAQSIISYIEDSNKAYPGRAAILDKTRATAETHQDFIFLNVDTGTPLVPKTLSNIFTQAFQAINAPAGAGLHSFRREFGEEEAVMQYKVRKEKKLPNSLQDIMVQVAKKLGQKSYRSPGKYIRKVNEDVANSQRAKDRELVQMQQIELTEAYGQVERLLHDNETLLERVERLEREKEELRLEVEARKRTRSRSQTKRQS